MWNGDPGGSKRLASGGAGDTSHSGVSLSGSLDREKPGRRAKEGADLHFLYQPLFTHEHDTDMPARRRNLAGHKPWTLSSPPPSPFPSPCSLWRSHTHSLSAYCVLDKTEPLTHFHMLGNILQPGFAKAGFNDHIWLVTPGSVDMELFHIPNSFQRSISGILSSWILKQLRADIVVLSSSV